MRRRTRAFRAGLISCCLASLFLGGCTSEEDSSDGPATESVTPTPRASEKGNEKALGEKASAALDAAGTLSPDDPRLVESGLERVADGIHTRPELKQGTSYQLVVACAGEGSVNVIVEGRSSRTVDCDGVSNSQRVAGVSGPLKVDVNGVKGSSGMVAWRITS